MTRSFRALSIAAMLLAFAFSASHAEKIVPIHPEPGYFDQPATASSGNTIHVAFIGAPSEAGPFTVYYAAVNGSTDFSNLLLSRDTPGLFVTPAVRVLDNVGATNVPGDNVYLDARHPRIALLSADRIVVLFQAKTVLDPQAPYLLFRASISLAGGRVSSIRVNRIAGIPAGDVQDVSFGIVAADNTARVAYSLRADSLSAFDVFYARISVDNAGVIRNPIRLSTAPGSNGSRPIPSLRLDESNRAHVAWAADNLAIGTLGNPAAVYYAMVREFNPDTPQEVESAAIAATRVISGDRRWGHPQTLVRSNSLVHILAGAETSPGQPGSLVFVNLNPDAAAQDNNAVALGSTGNFLLSPPGVALPTSGTFDLYHPEAWLDRGGRIHLTGYGSPTAAPVYYSAALGTAAPYLTFLSSPTRAGLGPDSSALEIPGDYSKAAFSFLGGKTVLFWSGTDNTGESRGSLNVTALPAIAEFVVFEESGCAVSPGAQHGFQGRAVDLLVLVLSIAWIGLRSRGGKDRFDG